MPQPVVDVFMGTGTGSFAPETTYLVEPSKYIGGVQAVKLVDMNGDGKEDIVFGDSGTTVGILYAVGNGTYSDPVYYALSGANNLALGDLNGDGVLDILSKNMNVLWGNTLCNAP